MAFHMNAPKSVALSGPVIINWSTRFLTTGKNEPLIGSPDTYYEVENIHLQNNVTLTKCGLNYIWKYNFLYISLYILNIFEKLEL